MSLPYFSGRTLVVFIASGVFIGLLVTAQFRSAVPSSSYLSDEIAVQKQLIRSFIDDQALLKSRIVALRDEINKNQERMQSNTEKNSLDTLKNLKKDVGLETAKGGGVEIILDDGAFVNREKIENLDQSLIHASDLRDIVNLLRSAKVDAISINDQRIIASTPITSVGNTILVNNFHLLPPFNIIAIGDPELISRRLTDSTALPDLQNRVKNLKIQYSFLLKNSLIVPVYNGNFSLKYIKEAQPKAS